MISEYDLGCFVQGKKQQLRVESLAALEKTVRDILAILGLLPDSYSEVKQMNFDECVS